MNTMVPIAHVGDINSNERGSGARYNGGKPAVELIPLRIIGEYYVSRGNELGEALVALGRFQEGAGSESLHDAIELVNAPWLECANGFDYGRNKYKAWNWTKGMPWSVPLACAGRHLLKMIMGEEIDHESGIQHAGLALCNITMLLTYTDTYPEGDDRPVNELKRTTHPSTN
jgi:hypothetical protein